MRLTLRTLLAWIDGVLAAPQQEELGGKVRASSIAPKLVERIAEIVARPGLAAPRVDGRGLAEDANTCAEFLDNVLPAEQLEAFERVCIDSDIHLAETADCHALLAELARGPDTVKPLERRLRSRLLERVAEQMAQPAGDQAHEEAAILVRAVKQAVDARENRGPRPRTAVGGRQAKPAWAAWTSAAVAVLLLVALAATLGWSLLSGGSGPRQVAGVSPAGEEPPAEEPPVTTPEPAPETPPPAADQPPTVVGGDATAPVAPAPHVEPAADATVDPAAAAIGTVLPLPVMQDADAPADDEDPAPAEPVAPAIPPPVAPPRGAVAEGGVVLHQVDDGDEPRWEPLAAGDALADRETLLVPEHAFPRLIRGDVSIRLHPGTLAQLATDADGTPRLEVIFGKAVVWTEAAEATVGVTAGGLCGALGIGPRQSAGVSVELSRQDGDDPAVTPPGSKASLFVGGGSRLRQTEMDGGPPGQPLTGVAVDQQLPPRQEVVWDSATPTVARIRPAPESPVWLAHTTPVGRPAAAAGAAVEARLQEGRPVPEALRALAAEGRVENRMAAAATLALLGDYDALVTLLCEERTGEKLLERQWDDLQAATVPLALARGANAAASLQRSFETRGPAGRGAELFDLARGGQPAAALVAALADDSLPVRRFAFHHLLRRFPDDPAGRLEYRPDRPTALNERGLDWWRKHVAASDGGPAAPSP